jgi:hypothetical protein
MENTNNNRPDDKILSTIEYTEEADRIDYYHNLNSLLNTRALLARSVKAGEGDKATALAAIKQINAYIAEYLNLFY